MTSVHDDTPPPPPYDEYEGGTVTPMRRPDHDPAAEQALLAALLQNPDTVPGTETLLDPDDFYDPRHELVWTAIHTTITRDGAIPDPVTVANQLKATGDLPRVAQLLPELATHPTANPLNTHAYARVIREHAIRRQLITRGTRFLQTADTATPDQLHTVLDDWYDFGDNLTHRLAGTTIAGRPATPNIDDLLADPDDEPAWIIPGLLEHQDRVIVTAEEGAGKSTLLRQIAITAAAGIHPFTLEPITPIRVLHVDVENTHRQSKRRYRPLRIQAGHKLDPTNLYIEIRTGGVDLTQPEDATWLTQLCGTLRPDLLLIGPIYKLANGDPTEEKSAKPVAMTIDKIREKYDLGVILEAHSAKAAGGQKKRPHEPYGWSGWMRWPEFGLWLNKDGTISHWRGAREERDWPTSLQRGGEWPWMPSPEDADIKWQQIRRARTQARRPLSQRELTQITGISKGTLNRILGPGGPYGHTWPAYNDNQHAGDEPR